MQTVISSLALTLVDDALALVTGLVRVVSDGTGSAIAAARTRLSAPVDRLARACDVAGVLPAATAPRRKRFDVFGVSATLRALRDLT
jgi:hypothetical protein